MEPNGPPAPLKLPLLWFLTGGGVSIVVVVGAGIVGGVAS